MSDLFVACYSTQNVINYFLFLSKGTVIRCSLSKLLEYERQFMCNKCRHVFTVEVEFEQHYNIPTPTVCPSADGCNSFKFTEMKDHKGPSKCKDYQELKIQEQVSMISIFCFCPYFVNFLSLSFFILSLSFYTVLFLNY